MTVKDITKEWLVEKGYEGLYNPQGNCECGLDDLFPCCEVYETLNDCEPAYLRTCEDCSATTRLACEIYSSHCYTPIKTKKEKAIDE